MKFGETFTEYLHGDQEWFLDKCSHVEYKRLKKVLKSCRSGRAEPNSNNDNSNSESSSEEENNGGALSLPSCHCESCPLCDQKFFSELIKDASEIAGCFSSRVRRLLHLHISNGMQRYMLRLRNCFTNDKEVMLQQGRMLIEYVTMNAIAIRKILKKYDKVHGSINGRNFRTKMRAEHIELLQSPWLIELGAFYISFDISNGAESGGFSNKFSCDLTSDRPLMTLTISDSLTLEYSLTCAICLETVFNSYALSCGHIFCKACACAAASVMIFEGLKAAPLDSRCPVCREKFFSELMKDASEIAGCFSSRVRRLLHLHISTGMQRYMLRVRNCFTNDKEVMLQQGRMLIEYVTMNAIMIWKILKK